MPRAEQQGWDGQGARAVEDLWHMQLIEGRATMLLEKGRSNPDAAQPRNRAIAPGPARTLAVRVPLVLTCEGGDGAGCHCAHAISVCSRHAAQLFPAILCSGPASPANPDASAAAARHRLLGRLERALSPPDSSLMPLVLNNSIIVFVTMKQFHYCIRATWPSMQGWQRGGEGCLWLRAAKEWAAGPIQP